MRYGASWISPATPGLPQAHCANPECRTLVVAITMVRGFCAQCAPRLGVREEAPQAGRQMTLGESSP